MRQRDPMILLIDNYDSFTYNLVQAFGALGYHTVVRRNDEIEPDEAETLAPSHIVISPGPGRPQEGGVSNRIIRSFAGRVPILGVCLGHQCLAHAFGGDIVAAPRLMHGKISPIHHDGTSIFRNLPNPFPATRYHSLLVEESSLPPGFRVTAWTDQGELMGMRHDEWRLEGVQFHPESFLCPDGPQLLRNYLENT